MSNAAEGSPASGRAPRIAVVTPHLGLGGAQRVVTHITGYWVDRGYDVTVITVLDDPPDFYRLSPGVKRVTLPEPVVPFVRLRRFLVRLIERRELLTDLPAAERARAAIGGPAPAAGAASGGGGAGGTAAGGSAGKHERRRLDFLRAVYRLLERMRDASVFPVARYRLFGRSVDRYARFLRAADQQTKALHILLTRIGADVVLSMLGTSNIMSVAASAGLPHRTVISERNDPSKQRLDPPWDDLRPLLYPGADAVSANSRGALDAMRAYCPAEKLCLAPNPLVLPPARARCGALVRVAVSRPAGAAEGAGHPDRGVRPVPSRRPGVGAPPCRRRTAGRDARGARPRARPGRIGDVPRDRGGPGAAAVPVPHLRAAVPVRRDSERIARGDGAPDVLHRVRCVAGTSAADRGRRDRPGGGDRIRLCAGRGDGAPWPGTNGCGRSSETPRWIGCGTSVSTGSGRCGTASCSRPVASRRADAARRPREAHRRARDGTVFGVPVL